MSRIQLIRLLLVHVLMVVSLLCSPTSALAQSCGDGEYCYYVPPAMPDPNSFVTDHDWNLSVASGTANVTYRVNGGEAVATTVTVGTPLVIDMLDGEAQGTWGTVETRGGFIQSDLPLVVASRVDVGAWNSSATIKERAFALGERFRLGGYNLNKKNGVSGGYDVASVYAPTGAQVTFTAPPGASNDFWSGQTSTSFTVSLAPGQTFVVKQTAFTITQCGGTHQLDGALVTASAPIAVLSGGRGWSGDCSISGGCGDEGLDNILPVDKWGTDFAVVNAPGTNSYGELVTVVADTDATSVYLDGSSSASAVLAAGEVFLFSPTGDVNLISASQKVAVYHNAAGATGNSSCELGLSFVAPLEFPNQLGTSLSFDVPIAGFAYVTVPTSYAASVELDGSDVEDAIYAVPGRPDISVLEFSLTIGAHSVEADGDMQLGVLVASGGTGLYAFLNEFRLPGCGNGGFETGEGCDDGNVADGDGCNRICRVEIGSALSCDETADCVTGAFCDLSTNRCVECLSAGNCNDQNDCTSDSCSAGSCAYAPASDGELCAGGVCYDDGGGSACAPCVDTTDSGGVDLGCTVDANECLSDGSGGLACGPCVLDADCDDGNDCTTDTCTGGGSPRCEYTAVSAGISCSAGVCDGKTPSACVLCIDDVAGAGQDGACSLEEPICDTTAATASCIECRTSSDCAGNDLCVSSACVAAGVAITSASTTSSLNPTVSGEVTGYEAGSAVDVTISSGLVEVDNCRAVVALDLSWSCVVGPLVASSTLTVDAEATDGVRTHADTATLEVAQCAGASDGAACSDATLTGQCRGDDVDSRTCCTGCWTGSSCELGTTVATCGSAGTSCNSCATYASCAAGSCGCDSGYTGDGTSSCVGSSGSVCASDSDCGLNLLCDTLDSGSCEATDTCGNGTIEAGEVCDDGATSAGDGCDASCRNELGGACSGAADCTSGTVCDLQASNTCEAADACGNGSLEAGETCDDGGVADGDGCDALCNNELGGSCSSNANCTADTVCDTLDSGTCESVDVCGNGSLEGDEACDDGANSAGDGCDAHCLVEVGGDCSGALDCAAQTVCDELGSGTCEPADLCGNGVVEVGETCDDGGVTDADGCDALCHHEAGGNCSSDANCTGGTVCDTLDSGSCEAADTCGNGTLESGEACDDGALSGGDGCDATCRREVGGACLASANCSTGTVCDVLGSGTCEVADVCGNGVTEFGESCDDGGNVDADGCDALCNNEAGGDCSSNANCTAGTVCDILGSSTCELADVCGNGTIESGETCDDGGVVDEDGCDALCKNEMGGACAADENCSAGSVCDALDSGTCEASGVCGNGVLDAGESCDDGAIVGGDGCDSNCKMELGAVCSSSVDCTVGSVCDTAGSGTCEPSETCGNGVLDDGEACDDAGTTAGDGCNELCRLEIGGACTGATDCAAGSVCNEQGSKTCEAAGSCGNGSKEAGEACDDGNSKAGDGCSASCKVEGQDPPVDEVQEPVDGGDPVDPEGDVVGDKDDGTLEDVKASLEQDDVVLGGGNGASCSLSTSGTGWGSQGGWLQACFVLLGVVGIRRRRQSVKAEG